MFGNHGIRFGTSTISVKGTALPVRPLTCRPSSLQRGRGVMQVTRAYSDSGGSGGFFGLTGLAVGGLILWGLNTYSVDAGSVGVIDTFGVVEDNVALPGFRSKAPWTAVKTFTTKTQLMETSQDVPTNEGLIVHLDVSILYRLTEPIVAPSLYKTIGTNYSDILVLPTLRSSVRTRTSELSAKALCRNGRTTLADELIKDMNTQLDKHGIMVEQVLLRSIQLPDALKRSIEDKLKSEQESQRMEFILTKETQEAERKRIEAQGIADFQHIVSKGIDERTLAWKGIEATLKLAESPNAKTVIVGAGKNGLPLILGAAGDKP